METAKSALYEVKTPNEGEKTDTSVKIGSRPQRHSGGDISMSRTMLQKTSSIDNLLAEHVDKDEDAVFLRSYEMLRLRTKKFMATSLFGVLWDVGFLFLSCISFVAFIHSTSYAPRPADPDERRFKKNLEIFELVSSAVFGFDWGLNYFMADDKREFFGSFYSMVDLVSVIPTYVLYVWGNENPEYCPADHFYYLPFLHKLWYLLNATSCARILRVLRIRRYLLLIQDEVQQKSMEMLLSFVVTLIFFSALMQFFERTDQGDESERDNMDFNVWLYVMLVTTSTVGYGEVSPVTLLGKFSIMLMIIFIVVMTSIMTNDLFETLRYSSYWARLTYNKVPSSTHVVVCGDLREASLLEFFSELFHEDHNNDNLHAVVLSGEPPWREMHSIMRNPKFALYVTFLEGSALNHVDLGRASVHTAAAIFIMTDKFTADPDQQDARAILQQFSLKRYISAWDLDHAPSFHMQLIRVENMRHLEMDTEEQTDVVVCLNEIKMGIMALNVLYPGSSILIFNLLMSFADGDDDSDDEAGFSESKGIEELDEDDGNDWVDEYLRGCDWEIYTTEISTELSGARLSSLSYMLYSRLGITLFGVQLTDIKGCKHILLNPEDFTIPRVGGYMGYQYTKVEGFVIAKNKTAADLSKVSLDPIAEGWREKGITREHSRLAILAVICQTLALERRQETMSSKDGILARHAGNHRESTLNHLREDFREREALHEDEGNDDSLSDMDFNEKIDWISLRKSVRKHDLATTQQEKLLQLEETYMRNNYYVPTETCDLSQVTITSSLDAEFPSVRNHIIIIVKSLATLYDLVKPLRAKRNKCLMTIVILSPNEMLPHVWSRLSQFEGLLFLRGNALQETDLLRAGIFKAKHVVLLADVGGQESHNASTTSTSAGPSHGSDVEKDVTVDADAIFAYQTVRRLNERADITVEIVRDDNIMFLDPSESIPHFKVSPQFAAGTVFISSLLDTLSVQSFYNPDIINIVNHLVSGNNAKLTSVDDYEELAADEEARKANDRLRARSSRIYEIPIPDGLPSMTYGCLFKQLIRRSQIPLALMRGIIKYRDQGALGNKLRYCFTNPPKDTEIFAHDSIMVLSPRPPSSTPAKEKALVREIAIAKAAKKNNTGNYVSAMNKEMNEFGTMLDDLDKRLTDTLQLVGDTDNTKARRPGAPQAAGSRPGGK